MLTLYFFLGLINKNALIMKKLLILFIVIAISTTSYAQDLDNLPGATKEQQVKDEKRPANNNGNINLLDVQTNVYKTIFNGETVGGVDFGNVDGFLDLVEKMDLTPEQKEEFRSVYFLQSREPNQKTKDSLGQVLRKKMLEAEKEANEKH